MPHHSHHGHTTHLLDALPLSFDHDRNMVLLYLMRAIHQLQARLVMFFVPVFIFKLGWDGVISLAPLGLDLTAIQTGMVSVAAYYLVFNLTSISINIPLSRFFARIGMARTFALSQPIIIMYFLVFAAASVYPWLILLGAVLHSFKDMSFWHPAHVVLAAESHDQSLGEDIGVLQFGMELLSVLAPFLGGLLTVAMGFEAVFGVGAILSLAGMIAALRFEDLPEQDEPTSAGVWSWLTDPDNRNRVFGLVGQYWNSAAIVVWSLYVLVLLGTVDALGLLFTISLFVSLVISVVAGIYVDHNESQTPYYVTVTLMAINWLARTQVFNPVAVAITDTIENVLQKVNYVFFQSHYLRGPSKRDYLQHFVAADQVFNAAALVFWAALGGIFLIAQSWSMFLVIGAVGILLSVMISR